MLDQHATAEPEVEHREAQTAECAPVTRFTATIADRLRKARLRLRVVMSPAAPAVGAQNGTDSGDKRQHGLPSPGRIGAKLDRTSWLVKD
jgi:hypothetical protein